MKPNSNLECTPKRARRRAIVRLVQDFPHLGYLFAGVPKYQAFYVLDTVYKNLKVKPYPGPQLHKWVKGMTVENLVAYLQKYNGDFL